MKTAGKDRKLSPWNSAHLNVVRSVATLAVVAEHTLRLWFLNDNAPGLLPWFVEKCSRAAGESVMVFFVLSGFFIASIVLRSKHGFTWQRYLIDRMSRLYVVLLPALLFTAGLDVLTRHTGMAYVYLDRAVRPFLDTPISQHHTIGIFLGNLSFLQLVTVPAFGSDLPLWSLSSEFWYYMMFPFACLAFMAGSRFQKVLYAIGFALWLIFFPHRMVKYFLIWLFGAFLYWCPTISIGQASRRIMLWLSTAAVAAVLFLPQTQNLAKWNIDLAFSIAFSVWLFFLVRTEEIVTAVQPWYDKVGAGLAACSYSIYVTHFPILLLLRSWRGGQSWQLTPVHAAYAAGLICSVILFGWAFAQATEAHTNQARKLLFLWTTPSAPSASAALPRAARAAPSKEPPFRGETLSKVGQS